MVVSLLWRCGLGSDRTLYAAPHLSRYGTIWLRLNPPTFLTRPEIAAATALHLARGWQTRYI
jgi:hypothetical protein